MKDTILKMLDKKGTLPPFPDILINLQKKFEEPYVSAEEIGKLIEVDPVLSGNILNLSNSVYYKRGYDNITSLADAVNQLGLTIIKHLVFSLKLTGLFSKNSVVDLYQFWCHSIGVAIITRRLTEMCNTQKKIQDIAYLSGLMHDVGIMVFAFILPDRYLEFLNQVSENQIPLEDQELLSFGIDHQELGAYFIKKEWQVDDNIADFVRYHHSPDETGNNSESGARFINIANSICNSQGYGNGLISYSGDAKNDASRHLGLKSEDIDLLIEDVDNAIDQAAEIINSRQ